METFRRLGLVQEVRQVGLPSDYSNDDEIIQRVQSTYFRAPALIDQLTPPNAWMSHLYHPARAGNLIAIDGNERWLFHNYLLPDESDFDVPPTMLLSHEFHASSAHGPSHCNH
jgi:hypothetical protein